jgi:hypothetical protein
VKTAWSLSPPASSFFWGLSILWGRLAGSLRFTTLVNQASPTADKSSAGISSHCLPPCLWQAHHLVSKWAPGRKQPESQFT